MTNIIKSIEEYRKMYFPQEWKRRNLAEMSPAELGEYLAKNLIIDLNIELEGGLNDS